MDKSVGYGVRTRLNHLESPEDWEANRIRYSAMDNLPGIESPYGPGRQFDGKGLLARHCMDLGNHFETGQLAPQISDYQTRYPPSGSSAFHA